jgi:aspartyl-tRNA(Asn)/glutamyl-tRNA(Gln) amidotransferase subunit C
MSLTQEQIKKLSINLSKLSEPENDFVSSSNDILNYMEMLNNVDTTGVVPTISVSNIDNTLRSDVEVEKTLSKQDLLNKSQQKVVADHIAVSNIMQ